MIDHELTDGESLAGFEMLLSVWQAAGYRVPAYVAAISGAT